MHGSTTPATSRISSGTTSNTCSSSLNAAKGGGHAPTNCALSSTPFSTWPAAAAPGACCRTTFPPWGLVSYYFYTWRDAGLLEQIHDILRVSLRQLEDREPTPSAAVVDSQSVKTTEVGGPKGYDAGKKNRRPQAASVG